MDEHFEELKKYGIPTKLAYPIVCESEDLDGDWILVDLVEWLGKGKWKAFDEDGADIVVDSSHLRNPRM